MLQQDLCAQVQEVGRFVQHQEIGIVQQQRGQLHACLPTTRKGFHGPIQVGTFDLKLSGNFSATPIGLLTVADQKIHGRFALLKRIVLPEVADSQRRMVNHITRLQFFGPHDGAQER